MGFSISQNRWIVSWLAYLQSAVQVVLFAVLLGLLTAAFWRYQNTNFTLGESKISLPGEPIVSSGDRTKPLKTFDHYQALAWERDLFQMKKEAARASADQPTSAVSIKPDLAARYLLQGIVQDHDPMVIIKDLQSRKTLFVYRSGFLEGSDAKVTEILPDRVILEQAGEIFELIKK